MKSPLMRFAVAASTALVGLLLMIGCGGEPSPLAQDTDAASVAPVDDGRFTLTLSSPGMRPAAKSLYSVEGRVVSWTVGPDGDDLEIVDDGPLPKDELKVTFTVPAGALDADVLITMEVVGQGLSDLVVHFGPSGLSFNPHSSLAIQLQQDLYTPEELDGLRVQHIDGAGNLVEEIIPGVEINGDSVIITLGVPGFSRYSLP